jgi:molybdopterin molybdotransferase
VVYRRPLIGVFATGDELVLASDIPGPGQIRNSNSPQLLAQALELGCPASFLGTVSDDFDATVAAVSAALEQHDAVLLSGGVSMGDFDHVPEALKACGVRILFDRVAVKPGKPATFGILGNKAVFGLPGNPVSTFVIFELLTRPYLMARMGLPGWKPVIVPAVLSEPIRTRNADREQWLPVRIEENGRARPLKFHGSGHFASLVDMSGLVSLPVGVLGREAGETIEVRLV